MQFCQDQHQQHHPLHQLVGCLHTHLKQWKEKTEELAKYTEAEALAQFGTSNFLVL